MEGATPNPGPGVPGVQSTGPPPSMVKSGISTIEDLSCKDQQTAQCCPAEATVEISALTEQSTVNVTAEKVTVTAVTNSNSGKTTPDVAIVLVHNH